MTLDTAVSTVTAAFLAALIAVFATKRIYRALPVFFSYLLFGFCCALATAVTHRYFQSAYTSVYIAEIAGDTLFYFCALAELRGNLARYNGVTSPGWRFLTLLFVLNGMLLDQLSKWTFPFHFSAPWRLAVHTMQATTVLELAGLLALIEWSMLRRFHWPHREFRIVSGFGFSAVVEIAAAILYSYRFVYSPEHFLWMNLLTSVTAMGVQIYWLQYFAFEDGGVAEGEKAKANLVAAGSWNERDGKHRLVTVHAIERGEAGPS